MGYTSCDKVISEMLARVHGEDTGAWQDPHNHGTYLEEQDSPKDQLNFMRVTGDQKYTDKMRFTFADASDENGGAQCEVSGCSESQGFSFLDFSTNYCDLRNLYCGEDEGCTPVGDSFKIEET